MFVHVTAKNKDGKPIDQLVNVHHIVCVEPTSDDNISFVYLFNGAVLEVVGTSFKVLSTQITSAEGLAK